MVLLNWEMPRPPHSAGVALCDGILGIEANSVPDELELSSLREIGRHITRRSGITTIHCERSRISHRPCRHRVRDWGAAPPTVRVSNDATNDIYRLLMAARTVCPALRLGYTGPCSRQVPVF